MRMQGIKKTTSLTTKTMAMKKMKTRKAKSKLMVNRMPMRTVKKSVNTGMGTPQPNRNRADEAIGR